MTTNKDAAQNEKYHYKGPKEKDGLKVCIAPSWLKIKIPIQGFRRHSDKSSGPTT